MIINVFPFFNELDLLEVRLHELWDVVDWFVLSEATRTHSGEFKGLHFQGNLRRFKPFLNKIIPIIVTDMPITPDEISEAQKAVDGSWAKGDIVGPNWTRERWQRDAIQRVVGAFDPNDIIILDDADEMVRPEIISQLDTLLPDGLVAVEQSLHSYYLNWKCFNMPWHGTKIFRKKHMTTLSRDRFHTNAIKIIPNGGWHLNFMGGVDAIQSKVRAYVHQEFNTPEVFNLMDYKLKEQQDALGRLYQYSVVPIDNTYPQYIVKYVDKFKQMGWIY